MPSTASITLNDYDGQAGIIGFNVDEVTDANLVSVASGMGAIRSAIEAVTLGVSVKSELSIIARFNASNASATSELAQRGNKWLVQYRDVTQFLDAGNTVPNPGYQKAFSLDIPTADLSFRNQNQDIVYSASDASPILEFQTLAQALELTARSPYSGDISVETISAVTRSGG